MLKEAQKQEIQQDPETIREKEYLAKITNEKKENAQKVAIKLQTDKIVQKENIQKKLAERRQRLAKKKANGSQVDSSGSSLISPAQVESTQSIGFVPILSKVEMENDEVNKTQGSDNTPGPLYPPELTQAQKKVDLTVGNIHEISAINNTTVQSSINTSQIEMIRKLHQSEVANNNDSGENKKDLDT